MPEESAKSVPARKPRLALDPFVDAFMRFHHMDRGWRDTQTDQELGEVLATLIGRRLGRTLQIRL